MKESDRADLMKQRSASPAPRAKSPAPKAKEAKPPKAVPAAGDRKSKSPKPVLIYCYQFAKDGKCTREGCTFPHLSKADVKAKGGKVKE